MYFVGTKSVYVLQCPLPGSVINRVIPQPVSQDAKIHYDLQVFLRENGKLFHWNEMLI